MKRTIHRLCIAILSLYFFSTTAFAARELIPGGQVIGLELSAGSVTVAAFDDSVTTARDAGLRIGDRIIAIDGKDITCAEDVRRALNVSQGSVDLLIHRGGKEITIHMEPAVTTGGPRLGVYLRQGITGIGTVTFYDPHTHTFGTLGHGVNDAKGNLLPMSRGSAYTADIVSVQKGKTGQPGQLKGALDGAQLLGDLTCNTEQGVFGKAPIHWDGKALPCAEYGQIHAGRATIRSTVTDGDPRDYSVEILKIYPKNRSDSRNFLLKVTDPALLSATGGIVQGMSGSPILQDGKLIGAVTHVLVNDPTMGYGIFIENMLDAAG